MTEWFGRPTWGMRLRVLGVLSRAGRESRRDSSTLLHRLTVKDTEEQNQEQHVASCILCLGCLYTLLGLER